jgi:uncharacterized protein YlxW (UPF0749 family)
MNQQEMVVIIVAIVMFAGVLRARYGYQRVRGRGRGRGSLQEDAPDPEAARLKDEVRTLKERIIVLERIATDKESSLEREIEQLRDR